MMLTLKATPAWLIRATRGQWPAPMFCAAIAFTPTPRAIAGSRMRLSRRCAAPKPATTPSPKLLTSDMITAVPA